MFFLQAHGCILTAMAFVLAALGLLTLAEASTGTGLPFVGYASGHRDFSSKDVHVTCLEKSMKIFIPKEKLPNINLAQDLQLIDPACTATDNGTHFIAHPWLKDCGTSKRYQYDGIVYSNELTSKYPKPNEVDKTCPRIKIKFACFYPFYFAAAIRNVRVEQVVVQCEHIISTGPALEGGVLSLAKVRARLRMRQKTVQCPMIVGVGPEAGLGVQLKTTLAGFQAKRRTILCKELINQGNYVLQMMVYSDDRFSELIEGKFSADKEVVEVFYEIRLYFGDQDVEIMPSTCYATPDSNPNNKIKYYFLRNGCILDDTVQFYVSGPRNSRFSIKSFRFTGQQSTSFFVHCQVDVCVLNDVDSICRQGCRDDSTYRSKRNNIGWSIRTERKITRAPELTSMCLDGKMEITMKKHFYPGLHQSIFHLNDRDCQAKDNGTHYVFNNEVNGCGAIRTEDKSNILFRNMVYLNADTPFTVFFPMEVSCSFSKGQSESARTKFMLETPRRYFKIINQFPYRMQFKVLVAYDIAQKFTKSPVQITTKRSGAILDIINEVKAGGIILRTKHCAWKTSLFSKQKIQLIHKGCPSHKRVIFYEHNEATEVLRFMLDPSVIPQGRNAHLVCTVIVCNLQDPECSKTCGLRDPITGQGVVSRRRRSTDVEDVKIMCKQTSMTISLRKTSVPSIEARRLHLLDVSCRAFENKTHFIFTTPLGACGTGIIQDSGGLAYTNQITQDVSDLVIVRQQLINIPFRCLYRARTSASSGQFRLRSPQVLLSGSSKGVHEVKVKIFTDSTFTKERDGTLALVDPEDDMYFEVGMATPQPGLAIILDQCYGKPTGSQNEREKYVFIRDGCSTDETIKRYSSPRSDKARFSIKPFQFSETIVNSIYVTCKVSACNPNDPAARCYRECTK